jgi:hypothetical protein
MAISFIRYVNITSGVGAGATVNARDLIGRFFTSNTLVPHDTVLEFNDPTAADVASYFGSNSDEYAKALQYYQYLSKNITRAQKVSFGRWVNTNEAPRIYGSTSPKLLSTFTGISTGAFALTLGATTNIISGLDFTGAISLAAVAAIIQAGIRAETGTQWTGATVTFDASRGSFDLVGGSAVAASVSVQPPGTGTDISALIGWRPNSQSGAIWSDGALLETLTDALNRSVNISTNFGSFNFIPTLDLDQHIEIGAWNTVQNVLYQYHLRALPADAVAWKAALDSYAGVGVTNAPLSAEFPEILPMSILSATNYSARNSVQNYMFQQAPGLTPSVTDDATANTFDDAGVNYYGVTQTAGQLLAFYQRGVLTGLPTNPTDMNTYANEQWLKDAAGSQIMQLLLALPKVSANVIGCAQVRAVLQSVIALALFNGTISVGKTLNTVQKLYIAQITGEQDAWHQIQNIGYWLAVTTQQVGSEYQIIYTLVYSKDDVVRKVVGTHILI